MKRKKGKSQHRLSWFRRLALRWLLKDISVLRKINEGNDSYRVDNMFGMAGMGVVIFSFHEDDIFKSNFNKSHRVRECQDPFAVKETIFYIMGYFEAWCEEACEKPFGLVYHKDYYFFFFTSTSDASLFKLTHMTGNKLDV